MDNLCLDHGAGFLRAEEVADVVDDALGAAGGEGALVIAYRVGALEARGPLDEEVGSDLEEGLADCERPSPCGALWNADEEGAAKLAERFRREGAVCNVLEKRHPVLLVGLAHSVTHQLLGPTRVAGALALAEFAGVGLQGCLLRLLLPTLA